MRYPRQYLPATRALQAFEAVARHGSFSAAARELALTQGAISKQVAALEAQVGTRLIDRERQRATPTPAGERYLAAVREALRGISSATLSLATNPHGGTLRLAILPTFGTRWLAPRLPDFQAAWPGITVNLVTRLRPFDFRDEPLDAAISVGDGPWPDTEAQFLMAETLVPACAPALAARIAPGDPRRLREAGLLHLATRPDAWAQWMAAYGGPQEGLDGMEFDQFATVAQAAGAGLGVALLPGFLFRREIDDGSLVVDQSRPVRHRRGYALVWPPRAAQHPPLQAIRQWLGELLPAPSEPSEAQPRLRNT